MDNLDLINEIIDVKQKIRETTSDDTREVYLDDLVRLVTINTIIKRINNG